MNGSVDTSMNGLRLLTCVYGKRGEPRVPVGEVFFLGELLVLDFLCIFV